MFIAYRSLNVIVAQLKNRPFFVNATIELKIVTARTTNNKIN